MSQNDEPSLQQDGSRAEDYHRGLVFGPAPTMNAIIAELQLQSDRGMAVLGGAYLEWQIRAAIKARLPRWELPKAKGKPIPMGAKIFGSDDTAGELGFLDHCRMAYCLGLTGPAAYRDLERIARIRNRFAHHMEVNSFDGDPKVSSLCSELESLKLFVGCRDHEATITMPRWRFFQAIQALWTLLFVSGARQRSNWSEPDSKSYQGIYW